MSIKEFSVISKLGNSIIMQVKELIPLSTKWSDYRITNIMRWRKWSWATCRIRNWKTPSIRSEFWHPSTCPISLDTNRPSLKENPSGRNLVISVSSWSLQMEVIYIRKLLNTRKRRKFSKKPKYGMFLSKSLEDSKLFMTWKYSIGIWK